jgi:hypothetical protein
LVAARSTLPVALQLVTLRRDVPLEHDMNEAFSLREEKPLSEINDADFSDADNDGRPSDDEADAEAAGLRKPGAATTQQTPAPEQRSEPRNDAPAQQQADTTALARIPRDWSNALEPCSFRDAWTTAKLLTNSRLFAVASPEACMAIVMAGRSMGLDAVTSLRGFHIIKGKPVMSADLLVGLVLRSGKAKYFQVTKSTPLVATYRTHRHGDPEPVEFSFSIEDARRAKLSQDSDSNWSKYPAAMCRHRCSAELARAVYPDVVMNVYVPEEMDEES